jgi:hypothetical protein
MMPRLAIIPTGSIQIFIYFHIIDLQGIMRLQNDFYSRNNWFSPGQKFIDDDGKLSHVREL